MGMTDGLLGWPGLGQGGSLEWKAIRLNTGDVWFAPKSGFYFITGCGGGAPSNVSQPGGSGAALVNYPLYIPEGNGGQVVIGAGGIGAAGTAGTPGTKTSLGDVLILGPGNNSTGATGIISGTAIRDSGLAVLSQGSDSYVWDGRDRGGDGCIRSANLSSDILENFRKARWKSSRGGTDTAGNNHGENYGAGGGKQITTTPTNGGAGFLAIAWI